jgi:hypothetical protein
VTLGAKGRDTSAAAAVAAAGALADGVDTAFALVDAFFADFFFGALFFLPEAFFLALRLGAALRFALFFLPAFLRADDFLRFAPLRAGFLRAAGFRAARLRLLFLRAAMCTSHVTPTRRRVLREFYAARETMGKENGELASFVSCASR